MYIIKKRVHRTYENRQYIIDIWDQKQPPETTAGSSKNGSRRIGGFKIVTKKKKKLIYI